MDMGQIIESNLQAEDQLPDEMLMDQDEAVSVDSWQDIGDLFFVFVQNSAPQGAVDMNSVIDGTLDQNREEIENVPSRAKYFKKKHKKYSELVK